MAAMAASRGAQGEGGRAVEYEDVDQSALRLVSGFRADVIVDERGEADGCLSGRHVALSRADGAAAEKFLEWLIYPLDVSKFYAEYWEQRPFVIKRPKQRRYYEGWFHKRDIEQLLEERRLEFRIGVDVTKYVEGERQTLNGEGIADPKEVWKRYKEGCSVRVLHPQRWSDPIWLMLSTLERHWNSIAGCNAYLTPQGTQGFSPHYDDIEAFVLQSEGRKQWRCYAPRSPQEVLPRFSSPNFAQEEIGDPILEVDLEPGDLLFMPRGTIHQAVAAEDIHSLHITISTGQGNSWADFLGLAIPRALELASEEHMELRKSIPRETFDFMGAMHSDQTNDSRRTKFIETIQSLMQLVMERGPWDSGVDQMAVDFLHRRLPLYKGTETQEGKGEGTEESGKKRRREEGVVLEGEAGGKRASSGGVKLTGKSKVRLVAPGIARLVVEEEVAVLYHMLHNTRYTHNVGVEEDVGDEGEGEGEDRLSEEAEDLEEETEGELEGGGVEGSKTSLESCVLLEKGKPVMSVKSIVGNGELQERTSGDSEKRSKKQKPDADAHVHAHADADADAEVPWCGGEAGASWERGRLEFPLEHAEALDGLLRAYPAAVAVGGIALDSKRDCIQLAAALVGEGLLLVVDG